jgi:hypothetical protein
VAAHPRPGPLLDLVETHDRQFAIQQLGSGLSGQTDTSAPLEPKS